MAECIECKAYTKFVGGLCIDCYYKINPKRTTKKGLEDFDKKEAELNAGLTDKEYIYRYDIIKGRGTETLIQELFLVSAMTFSDMEWRTQFQG